MLDSFRLSASDASSSRSLAASLLELGRRRRERPLALVQLGLAAGERPLAARNVPRGRSEDAETPPPVALALELALGRLELALALAGPFGRVTERRLHAGDLARRRLLDPVPLGRQIALELLQAAPFGLERLDRRLRIGLDRHALDDTLRKSVELRSHAILRYT